MADFGDWYRSVPEITRYWFTGTTVMPLLGRFGLFSPYYMLLEWHLFFYKFQVKQFLWFYRCCCNSVRCNFSFFADVEKRLDRDVLSGSWSISSRLIGLRFNNASKTNLLSCSQWRNGQRPQSYVHCSLYRFRGIPRNALARYHF